MRGFRFANYILWTRPTPCTKYSTNGAARDLCQLLRDLVHLTILRALIQPKILHKHFQPDTASRTLLESDGESWRNFFIVFVLKRLPFFLCKPLAGCPFAGHWTPCEPFFRFRGMDVYHRSPNSRKIDLDHIRVSHRQKYIVRRKGVHLRRRRKVVLSTVGNIHRIVSKGIGQNGKSAS